MSVPFQPLFNYPNNKLYQYEVKPVLLSCNFVVDSTNGNGLGIRQLKGSGIANIFMNTSSTPGAGTGGIVNPNPAAGVILVQLQNNYSRYLGGFSGQASPLTGSNLTSTTAHTAYVITALGTATAAQWLAAGVPAGITPALGVAFIAKATGAIGGSASVKVVTVSGIQLIEVVGDPNASLNNSNIYQNGGGQMILQTLGATNSSTTTLIPHAPADGTVISLSFYLSNSSVQVNGQ